MAKVGYIFKADLYEGFDADKEWMQQYGCIQVVEESVEHESLRPQWKQLISKLERGDEIVVPKFSNAVRGRVSWPRSSSSAASRSRVSSPSMTG